MCVTAPIRDGRFFEQRICLSAGRATDLEEALGLGVFFVVKVLFPIVYCSFSGKVETLVCFQQQGFSAGGLSNENAVKLRVQLLPKSKISSAVFPFSTRTSEQHFTSLRQRALERSTHRKAKTTTAAGCADVL